MKNEKSYYGPFFWIAICSFIVPIFVAVRAFDQVRPTTKPTPVLDASGVDHKIWDYLIKKYVENGLVDYDGISKDYLFWDYISQIEGCDPEKLSTREEKFALHCNAYNALVIQGVINRKIDTSVMDYQHGFFTEKGYIFAGETMSLDHLEKKIILPVFQDERVHMALVCAAVSCPPLRGEAYFGDRIEKQLADQARLFANDPEFVDYDKDSNTLKLSTLLKWYQSDFEKDGSYLEWIQSRVESDELRSQIDAAIKGDLEVSFNKYDWSLNSQKGGSSHSSGGGGEFGSGSIPNQ